MVLHLQIVLVFLGLHSDFFKIPQALADPANMTPDQLDDNRIIGGHDAKPHSYPGMLVLLGNGGFTCAASIYNKDWVVTAAHCGYGVGRVNFTFLAGDHNIGKDEGYEQHRNGVEVKIHEKYNSSTYENDIAMHKVSPPFEFTTQVRPSPMAPKGWNELGLSTAIGWGFVNESIHISHILQEVDIPIVTNDDCAKDYSDRKRPVFDTNICAAYPEGGKDTCSGDSGGPLYFKKSGAMIQIGIVSWGIGCALPKRPGVYTRISEYLDWMKGIAGPPGGKPVCKKG